MLDPQREIQALVDTFVEDLSQLAKRIAIEQIKAAFEFGAPNLPAYVPSPISSAASSGPALSAGGGASTGKRGRRGARDAGDVADLRGRLLSAISDGPGQRTEDLNETLGTETPQLAPVLRKLVAEGHVRTEGARRGTRYYVNAPGDSAPGHAGQDDDGDDVGMADQPPA